MEILKADKKDLEEILQLQYAAFSYIGKTFVHPDYQGKGIGTKMMVLFIWKNHRLIYKSELN